MVNSTILYNITVSDCFGVLKWMLGFVIAGITALLIRVFF